MSFENHVKKSMGKYIEISIFRIELWKTLEKIRVYFH